MIDEKIISENNKFIVLDSYTKIAQPEYCQTEDDLAVELIQDLKKQEYEYADDIKDQDTMYDNVRKQISILNNGIKLNDGEWQRFIQQYLDNANENASEKANKIHRSYSYEFTLDDGKMQNIHLLDKKNLSHNKLQVIRHIKSHIEQTAKDSTHYNHYGLTILVNGLPLVHIELVKPGTSIRQAFNQAHRYSNEDLNSGKSIYQSPCQSLYQYVQCFIISNGSETRYFANDIKRNRSDWGFTMQWATSDNKQIIDLKNFTATFLEKNTLLKVLMRYTIFNAKQELMIMRPYQIAAVERILWKIFSSHMINKHSTTDSFGYIWHTAGSGKTLISFKAAILAKKFPFIDKVLFVVDRRDIDHQTLKEYATFDKDSVNGSEDTTALKRHLINKNDKIIVTTIQKLNNLITRKDTLYADDQEDVYNKSFVFIFDECHYSQFCEVQRNIRKNFTHFYQFGFTSTPVLQSNANQDDATASVFGDALHKYSMPNAVRDKKVLKLKIDYINTKAKYKNIEREYNQEKSHESSEHLLQSDERIKSISQYILDTFHHKTRRIYNDKNGFNAIFAVSSIDAAIKYYNTLRNLQENEDKHNKRKRLKIATIFSSVSNGEQHEQDTCLRNDGTICEESIELSSSSLSETDKAILTSTIDDYNKMFGTNFGIINGGFYDYYRDISKRMQNRDIDLLIVVGMFLTGFDAPKLNTLFVDKILKYHSLIQAYSRTNRIHNDYKTCGNIITFRDLAQNTEDALKLFCDNNNYDIVLEKGYKEYIDRLIEISLNLSAKFPPQRNIPDDNKQKEFVKTFSKFLKVYNKLEIFDEFHTLQEMQKVDMSNTKIAEQFKANHYMHNDDLSAMQDAMQYIKLIDDCTMQEYKSKYNDIYNKMCMARKINHQENIPSNLEDIEFEIELIKSQEID